MPEEATETGSGKHRGWVGRAASLGITLILAAALVFFARDLVPAEVAQELTRRLGIEEMAWLLSSGVERDARGSGSSEVMRRDASGRVAAHDDRSDFDERNASLDDADVADLSVVSAELERDFVIQFPSDSDLLDNNAWIALDRAAALLRAQPEWFAVITHGPDQPMDEQGSPDLAMMRMVAVEQYLLTAGVEPDRLRQEDLSSNSGKNAPEESSERFITIVIGTGLVR